MNTIITMVTIGIINAVFVALITYFVTSLSHKNVVKTLVKEMISIHNKIHHQIPVVKQIEHHENSCIARKDFTVIRSALIFIVTKQGGNPNDLGL
jgi:hypothetical protein